MYNPSKTSTAMPIGQLAQFLCESVIKLKMYQGNMEQKQ